MAKKKNKALGETVLVTGASSGIGEALAKRFAKAGHDLVLVARSRKKLKALAESLETQHGVSVLVEVADLSVASAASKLAAKMKRKKVEVGILVNNAGVNAVGEFVHMPAKKSEDIIALNISAATEVLSAFLAPMVDRGRGRVLNIVSTSAFAPVPYMATYAASKAYLLSLTESLSEELKGTGVTITGLCPGVTATPMVGAMEKQDPALTRLISFSVANVDDVAEEGYDACMKGEVLRIPGYLNLLTTISSRAVPRWVVRRVTGILGRSVH